MLKRSTLLMTAALTLASASLMLSASAEAQPGKSAGKGKGQEMAQAAHSAPGHVKSKGNGHANHKGNGYGHGPHEGHDDHDDHDGDEDEDEGSGSDGDSGTTPVVGTDNCAIYYAGQHIVVGSVCATVVGDTLFVDYIMEGDYKVSGTHLWVGDSLASAPRNGSGGAIPGQFPYHGSSSKTQQYTYEIPLSQLNLDADAVCGEEGSLLIAAHGSVGSESAWAGETRFTQKGNWSRYFGVNPDCGGGDPDPDPEDPTDPEEPVDPFVIPPEGCYSGRVGSADGIQYTAGSFGFGSLTLTAGGDFGDDPIGGYQYNASTFFINVDLRLRLQLIRLTIGDTSTYVFASSDTTTSGAQNTSFAPPSESGNIAIDVLTCETGADFPDLSV